MSSGLRLVPMPGGIAPPAMLPDGGLAAVFRRYAPYVGRIALRLLGSRAEVDDVVQDVFVYAVKGLGKIRDREAVKGWLAAVTVRMVSRRLKKKRLKRFLGLEAAPGYERIEAPGATPEERALLADVYDVLDSVDVDARTAWILRYVEGERLDGVASACGCSLATAKRRITAAQHRIAAAFGEEMDHEG